MKIAKVKDVDEIVTYFEDAEMVVFQAENKKELEILNNLMSGLKKRICDTKEKDKKKYCEGCNDDFYNNKNPLGVEECWHLESAKLVLKRKVGLNEVPPWNSKPIKVLDCFRQKGFIFVDKNITK